MTIFGFSVIFMYFCDRTSLFLKIQKQFDFWQFTIANLLALALGLGTMKKPEKDLGFLNRDQTDEVGTRSCAQTEDEIEPRARETSG